MLSFEITAVREDGPDRKTVSVTWRDGEETVLLDSVLFDKTATAAQITERLRGPRAAEVRTQINPKALHKSLVGVREDVAE